MVFFRFQGGGGTGTPWVRPCISRYLHLKKKNTLPLSPRLYINSIKNIDNYKKTINNKALIWCIFVIKDLEAILCQYLIVGWSEKVKFVIFVGLSFDLASLPESIAPLFAFCPATSLSRASRTSVFAYVIAITKH